MVAVALRNRTRRAKVPEDLREEIIPKNIILIGPTGVGKTEIARRLSTLMNAPFVKVEATKYTEVGYVGRDVESMVRDLVEIAVDLVRQERRVGGQHDDDVVARPHRLPRLGVVDRSLQRGPHRRVAVGQGSGLVTVEGRGQDGGGRRLRLGRIAAVRASPGAREDGG